MVFLQRRVLFVCLGNICRSPLAEGVFRHHVKQAGLEEQIYVDSAGTANWHSGKKPDIRSIQTAQKHGVDISKQEARQLVDEDFEKFHYIIAMDASNLANIQSKAPYLHTANVRLLLQDEQKDVPDPYYGANEGFDEVYDLVSNGTYNLLQEIREEMEPTEI
ncbi:Low molecular weight protein-tyrosine-phosphatase YfkJ [Pseudovibrio sp. W64]|uniref:low molecular weight protein-tyrosine-phosphatase n=1 Tax=unclassified Pseudovibrio TaxID=2627060 RepID=UPI0007AE7045|nr:MULTISPECIES: low molecular weight protein-tyrosine-phosphatase [unclassified Pseudovibrio]KZK84823.1 Low molecular weight protein-tyrosine-phosphatase YfkJ [Pseudovibrio sp. W64]KZL00831.1 Low molecular weight protein-tyrosine-phosphatase YfkJ [Pseudovibrio sp. Ad5]